MRLNSNLIPTPSTYHTKSHLTGLVDKKVLSLTLLLLQAGMAEAKSTEEASSSGMSIGAKIGLGVGCALLIFLSVCGQPLSGCLIEKITEPPVRGLDVV